MPTSVASLILLVLLVFPGMAYVHRREQNLPERRRSTFRETTTVVVAGVAANFAAAWVLVVPAAIWPQFLPPLGIVISETRAYSARDYVTLMIWGTGLTVVATTLAFAGAWLLRNTEPRPTVMSSWWLLFKHQPAKYRKKYKRNDLVVRVACFLDDDSVLEGVVLDFNDHNEESGDRDLILGAPIIRTSAGKEQTLDSEVASVAARNMTAITVAYLFPELSEAPPDVDEPEGGS